MSKYFYIYIKRRENVAFDDIKKKMDQSLDWYRIDEQTWFVYSTSTAEKLYARFEPTVKDGGNIFICQLDTSNKQGWMSKNFWEWINKDRSKKAS